MYPFAEVAAPQPGQAEQEPQGAGGGRGSTGASPGGWHTIAPLKGDQAYTVSISTSRERTVFAVGGFLF